MTRVRLDCGHYAQELYDPRTGRSSPACPKCEGLVNANSRPDLVTDCADPEASDQ